MRVAICENNKGMLENVYQKVLQYQFDEKTDINKYSDGETLLIEVIEQVNEPYDLIIMDICLTDTGADNDHDTADGIEIVKKIKNITPVTLVVYMSSYDAFYGDLAQAEPFAFLRKPITTKELFRVLDDCQVRLDRIKYKYYSYKFDGKEERINLNDIVYFYSQHRTVHIRLNNGKEKYFYDKLDEVEKQLKKMGSFFLRINKSNIINLIYVEEVYIRQVVIDGQLMNITEKYKDSYNHYRILDKFF